jgi:hypothetical protein
MLVLHVGPHKTATTWLQQNFHHNSRALARAGWFYPRTGVRVRIAHHDISDHADEVLVPGSAKVAEIRRIAARATAAGQNILMSSEGFRNWTPRHLEALQAIVAPHRLHVVYTVRDPVSTLYSFWSQQVRNGLQLSFPDFRNKQFRRPAKSRILNPLLEIDAISGVSDADLTILLYDEIVRRKLDIFDVFVTEILKLPPLPHATGARANDRQPLEMTEFMRLVLIRVGSWRHGADVNIGRVFDYMLGRARNRQIIAAVGAVTGASRRMTVDRGNDIFDDVQRRLTTDYRNRLVPQPLSDRLFAEGAEEFRYYDQDDLLADPAVARLLDDVAVKFRSGGTRIRLVNHARSWLSAYRRALKFFRG